LVLQLGVDLAPIVRHRVSFMRKRVLYADVGIRDAQEVLVSRYLNLPRDLFAVSSVMWLKRWHHGIFVQRFVDLSTLVARAFASIADLL